MTKGNARNHLNGKRRVQQDPDALTPAQELFVAAYTANGGNGTRAYQDSHPTANLQTCAVESWRLLRTPKIRAQIDATRAARFKRYEMEGDEAMALLAARARADVADLYDDDGKALPVRQLPESIRLCVKGVRRNAQGEREVVLHDALKANELMAVASGRLRSTIDLLHKFDHVSHLAGTEKPPDEPPDEG